MATGHGDTTAIPPIPIPLIITARRIGDIITPPTEVSGEAGITRAIITAGLFTGRQMTPIIVRVPVWARSTTEIIVVHGLALPTGPETSVNALPPGRGNQQPLPGDLPPPTVSPLPVPVPPNGDRKSVLSRTSVSVSVDLGGRRPIKHNKKKN